MIRNRSTRCESSASLLTRFTPGGTATGTYWLRSGVNFMASGTRGEGGESSPIPRSSVL
jgi:hypothetical protein